jgi:16S rRNA (guanine(966)-N(2))-methyltransferase RsmD
VRKALFDSLGDLSDCHVLDLFSGSGALALESLSRGAASAAMVELETMHINCIERNLNAVRAAGVSAPAWMIQSDAACPEKYLARLKQLPDIIFADPPYPISAECFNKILNNNYFCRTLAGKTLIWELPDHPGAAGEFLAGAKLLDEFKLRRYANTMFATGKIKNVQ